MMDPRRTVLIVEDEAHFRRSVTAFLEDSGYRCIEAENGQEGLDAFIREQPDLVLTDLRMPVMDGIELITRLRTRSSDTRIIAISGMGDRSAPEEAVRLGARQCLTKPILDLNELEAAIERVLKET